MTDVTVISQRLGPIAEAGKNIAKLQTLVNDKSIPRKNVSQAMAGLLKRSGSKKEVDADATTVEPGAEKDDGDEEGESLGVLTTEQVSNQEAQAASEDAERNAASANKAVEITVTSPSEGTTVTDIPASTMTTTEQAVESPPAPIRPASTAPLNDSTMEPTNPFDATPAPTTPLKDTLAETKTLEPAEEDEATVTETLAAPPSDEKDLPVEPISPMDHNSATLAVADDVPPTLPVKDQKSVVTDDSVPEITEEKPMGDAEESPEVPTKTDQKLYM